MPSSPGAAAGLPFLIFYGEVSADSDGPMELCRPVAFETAPGSGKFQNLRIARNDLPDPELEGCVRGQVSSLALAKPTKTKIGVEYPLAFSPLD